MSSLRDERRGRSTGGSERCQHLLAEVIIGLDKRAASMDSGTEAPLLQLGAHAEHQPTRTEAARAKHRLAQCLPVAAVRSDVRVVQAEDHRRIEALADE